MHRNAGRGKTVKPMFPRRSEGAIHTSFTNFLIPVNVITVLFLNNFDGSRTQYNISWRLVVKHKVSLIFFNVYLLPCNHTLNVFLGPANNTLQLSPDALTGECIHT